jgi:hypothetical protein
MAEEVRCDYCEQGSVDWQRKANCVMCAAVCVVAWWPASEV